VVEFIDKVQEIFRPHRYKVIEGGRGSVKSWTVARAFLLEAAENPYRYLCCREVQNSLKESVHQLLKDQISNLGLDRKFDVRTDGISGVHVQSQFLYTGLAKHTNLSIKSYERIKRCWVEEAQKVTGRSWDILIPTIFRVPESEIWMTLNADLDTDETWVRFIVSPPPGTVVIHLNFRDNPWLTPEMKMEEQACLARSKEDHDNIWEGKPRSSVEGAVYRREVSDLMSQGRYTFCPYDARLKVHTVWDMGWNGACTIHLVQSDLSALRIIGYLEGRFVKIDEWAALLKAMPLNWGWDYLPHDGHNQSRQTGMSDYDLLRKQGRRVRGRNDGIPDVPVEVGMRVLRQTFSRIYLHKDQGELLPAAYKAEGQKILPGLLYYTTARLLECWKRFRYNIPKHGEPQAPVPDEYMHACDGSRYAALVAPRLSNENDWDGQRQQMVASVSYDPGAGPLG
jgi:phage terminase large subunit